MSPAQQTVWGQVYAAVLATWRCDPHNRLSWEEIRYRATSEANLAVSALARRAAG